MHKSIRGFRFFKKRSAGVTPADILQKGTSVDESQQPHKVRLNLEKKMLRQSDNLDIEIKKVFAKQSECQLNSVSTLKDTKSKLLIELSISSSDKLAATEILMDFVRKLAKPGLTPQPQH